MKRFTTTWTLVLMAVLSFSLMSCQDDDERLAYNLDGVWQGTIETDNQTYSTTICFFQDGYYASRGYGYEYDSGWSYGRTTRTNFKWWVSGGYIYLQYEDSPNQIIMDYDELPYSSNIGERLNGYFVDYYTGYDIARFYLRKMHNNDGYYAKENQHTEDDK